MHAVKWNRAIDVSDVVYHDVYIYFAGAEKIKTYFDSKPPCKLQLLQDHTIWNKCEWLRWNCSEFRSDSALNGKLYFQECLRHKNITRTGDDGDDDDAFHYPIKFCAVFFDDLIKRIG